MENLYNEFQTPITDTLLESLPQEVRDELLDIVNNVQFVQNLISPKRERAKDRPRDSSGKIIVDLCNPHILEDMDYFREAAIHYQKHSKYTFLRPNGSPNSEYRKWIDKEIARCWDGMVRPEDGEWIPGPMYFYLNYCPIIQNVRREGTKQADRIVDFPKVWEGIYWRFHYMDQARNGGIYNNWEGALNGAELASRGRSKSYSMASILAHNFIFGESRVSCRDTRSLVTAYQKEYLTKDGTLNKFVSMIDFCAQNTQFPSRRLKNSLDKMNWKMGFIDLETGTERGTKNEIIGVTAKDDISKLRGKRSVFIGVEEFGSFRNLAELYTNMIPSVRDGDDAFGLMYLMGTAGDKDSDFAGAQEIMYNPGGYYMYALPNVFDKGGTGKKEFVFFFPGYVNYAGAYNKDGVSNVISAIISILLNRYKVKYNSTDPNIILKTIAEVPITPSEAILRTKYNLFPVTDLMERLGQIDSNPSEFNDVYVGEFVLRDGEVTFNPTTGTPIREFPHKDNKLDGAVEIYTMPQKVTTDSGLKVPQERYIVSCLKEGEKVNTTSGLKKVEEVTLSDKLFDINGNEVKIYSTQQYYNTNPVYNVKLRGILDSTTFSEEHPIYCCTPKRKYNSYNRVKKLGVPERFYEYNFDFRKVSELKEGDYVKSPILYTEEKDLSSYWIDNNRVDKKIPNPLNNPDFWYLIGVILGDGWVDKNGISIVFNKKESWLIDRVRNIVQTTLHRAFNKIRDNNSVEVYSIGSFTLRDFFVTHFGKGAENKHIPLYFKYLNKNCKKALILGYTDTDGCVSHRGVEYVSVSKALVNDIQDILFSLDIISSCKVLAKSGHKTIVGRTHYCKEKYALSIGKNGANEMKMWQYPSMKACRFPNILITNHSTKSTFIKEGYLYIKIDRIIIEPYVGTVYNFACENHTFMCNYIPTHNCDPVDDDSSGTTSLQSAFVLDLWTDTIVAEYTGRPQFAEDYYEQLRRLCLFYNAKLNYENNKKGLFAYFSKMNSLHILTDTLEYLKDKDMIKGTTYGNKSKGVQATLPINNFARMLIRDWLLKPITEVTEIEGKEIETKVPNLSKLRQRALIKELIQWNTEGNFDRVSSLGMLMLLREDRLVLYGGDKDKMQKQNVKTLADDPFFEENYRSPEQVAQRYQEQFKRLVGIQ